MTQDMLTFIGATLGITGTILGAFKWAVHIYYEQQRKLASFEKSHMDAALFTLHETVSSHIQKINAITNLVTSLQQDLKYTNKHLNELKTDVKEYVKATDNLMRSAEKKLSELEAITKNISIMRGVK